MQKNNEVATLTTTDLQSAGINASLSSNDLLEVVAHDIYDKFVESVEQVIENGKVLSKKWDNLFDADLENMRQKLVKGKFLEEKEVVSKCFGAAKNTYWGNSIAVRSFRYEDISGGQKIKIYTDDNSFPTNKTQKVKLSISIRDSEKDQSISLNGITGTIETTVSKSFNYEFIPNESIFKSLVNETKQHNERCDAIYNFLPQSKILSVERFTREARVKMNKKIISNQSADFRKKISELFNIKL